MHILLSFLIFIISNYASKQRNTINTYNNDYYDYSFNEEDDDEFENEDEDSLSDHTLYFHEYEFDWDNENDWFEDEDYAKEQLPHACTHRLEVLDHKLCVIGKRKETAMKDINNPHREVHGSPVDDKNGGFVLNFKKHKGKESFNMKHINAEEMQHLWYNKPHPHILTRSELDNALKTGSLKQFGNTFSVTYHGMVFDFTKDKDWKKVNAHHTPRYMDNKHVRPKIVQNNDPAPQIQDQLDDQWEQLDHYNHFVKEKSYRRKRYKGPKLIIPPGTQNAAWPSDPHHALNLYIPNKRPRGAPRIKDLPGNWNKMWGRTPEADYLDYGTIYPQQQDGKLNYRIKGAQDFSTHPARVKSELPNQSETTNEKSEQSKKDKKKSNDKKDTMFGNVPTKKDKDGNVYVRPGLTGMNDDRDADGNLDKDLLSGKKDNYKEHNVHDTEHMQSFQGLSNPMMMNMMMTNPSLRMLMPMMMNKGKNAQPFMDMMNKYQQMMGISPQMMNMYTMFRSPMFWKSLPYMSMGYTPNLFGHGMPIYHGTQYQNNPLQQNKHTMAHQLFDDDNLYSFYDDDESDDKKVESSMYANTDKGPVHSPWRVKMRRCRLKNGQRVIFPASQVNMEKFSKICKYDPNAPDAKYSIDINVPV